MNVKVLQNALVIMGVLILIGFCFVAFVAYERMTGTGYFGRSQGAAEPNFPTGTAGAPAVTALGLSAEARIEAIHDYGNRILLVVRQPGLGDRLYLVDPKTGAVLSVLATGSAPTAPTAH